MNILSLFDGMSCLQIALNRQGIKYDKYYASEVDKHAIKVTMANYPATIQIGDVRNINTDDLPFIDFLGGGSPCQSFSFAGKRNGMSTKCEIEILTLEQYLKLKEEKFDFEGQSYLFWEYVRIKEALQKKNPNLKFLLENVMMGSKWQKILTRAIGVNPICINSALVSAQNRERLYWTNIYCEPEGLFGHPVCKIPQPKDKGIYWGDVRQTGIDLDRYYYTESAMQWLGRASQRLNKPLTIHNNDEKMQMVEASHYKKYSNQRFFGIVDLPSNESIARMTGRYLVDGKRRDSNISIKGLSKQFIEFRRDGKTNALTTVGKDNIAVPFTLPNRVPAVDFFFRYITPVECERLQTVPDNYTNCVSDTQRYRMLGNGWNIDTIVHILSYINY